MNLKPFLGMIAAATAAPLLAQTPAPTPATSPGPAPAAVQVTAGATVYGPNGAEVGTVEKVEGGNAVINTGAHSAAVPTSAIGRNEKGLLVSLTRDQLDAAVVAAEAKSQGNLASVLVVGAPLHSADGQPMGKVSAISAEGLVTVERESGSFALRRDSFATDANGLALRMTAAQINAALARQQQAAAAPAATAPAKP